MCGRRLRGRIRTQDRLENQERSRDKEEEGEEDCVEVMYVKGNLVSLKTKCLEVYKYLLA